MNVLKYWRAAVCAIQALVCAYLGMGPHYAAAVGVVPETSAVLIDENSGEAAIKVRNTDAHPIILHTAIIDTKEDPARLIVATPLAARLEPGESQLVRFMLINKEPLKYERMKRVVFEGLPPELSSHNAVDLIVRQDLPVIVKPAALPVDKEPWKRLTAQVRDGVVTLSNPSDYVVRLEQRVQILPQKTMVTLSRRYILPGEQVRVGKARQAGAKTIRLFPMTRYGYTASAYDLQVTASH
ncbi:fimbria/pilus periplasmic chaperone [Mycetohabitans rhizoxinica]|uniref:fimbria/pilus chaperone family protein n=1 Tax=Mycetohabitans rhizoxinica TaxID=412963 RepID=UPI0030CCE0A2